jgi:hypothetical protein
MHVIVDGVIRGCAMTYMRMSYQPNLFEHLEVAIDRG